jgi:uncharacterized protein
MITEEQKNKIINYFLPYKPVKIGLFGSRVRGDNRADSDLDILYTINKKISLMDLVRMERELSTILQMEVDLADESALTNMLLRKYIMQDIKFIYEEGQRNIS